MSRLESEYYMINRIFCIFVQKYIYVLFIIFSSPSKTKLFIHVNELLILVNVMIESALLSRLMICDLLQVRHCP